jgi:hypothetical protein
LLNRLAAGNFKDVSSELRSTLLDYYANFKGPVAAKTNKKEWERTTRELEQLKAFTIEKPGS